MAKAKKFKKTRADKERDAVIATIAGLCRPFAKVSKKFEAVSKRYKKLHRDATKKLDKLHAKLGSRPSWDIRNDKNDPRHFLQRRAEICKDLWGAYERLAMELEYAPATKRDGRDGITLPNPFEAADLDLSYLDDLDDLDTAEAEHIANETRAPKKKVAAPAPAVEST